MKADQYILERFARLDQHILTFRNRDKEKKMQKMFEWIEKNKDGYEHYLNYDVQELLKEGNFLTRIYVETSTQWWYEDKESKKTRQLYLVQLQKELLFLKTLYHLRHYFVINNIL